MKSYFYYLVLFVCFALYCIDSQETTEMTDSSLLETTAEISTPHYQVTTEEVSTYLYETTAELSTQNYETTATKANEPQTSANLLDITSMQSTILDTTEVIRDTKASTEANRWTTAKNTFTQTTGTTASPIIIITSDPSSNMTTTATTTTSKNSAMMRVCHRITVPFVLLISVTVMWIV